MNPHTLSLSAKVIFIFLALLSVSGVLSPPAALGAGIVLALTVGEPFPRFTHIATRYLLQASVVGLGFGMNLYEVWAAGKNGFLFTVATIFGTLLIGWLLGKALKVESQVSCLVSCGTAICGGSAIAAVGAVLNTDKKAMSVALGTVFILNAVALFIFPPIGKFLGMSQQQFGLWAAIAIHDTSSVVGSAARFGEEALQIATTVKLSRALWIIPIALGVSMLTRREGAKITIPWFIFFFLLAAGLRTSFPGGETAYVLIKNGAQLGLTLTLFLIGSGLSKEAIKSVGFRALLQGVILWAIISLAALSAVWRLA